jgi:hypothetical protein
LRREQADLADQGALLVRLIDLDHLDLARRDVECRGGVFAALHDEIAGFEMHRPRVGQKPIHVHVALGGFIDVANEVQHRAQPPRIDRQQDRIQCERRVCPVQEAVAHRQRIRDDRGNAQGNHGPGVCRVEAGRCRSDSDQFRVFMSHRSMTSL